MTTFSDTNHPNLDELKGLANKLQHLLDDPHPGLFTWCESLNDLIKKISEFSA